MLEKLESYLNNLGKEETEGVAPFSEQIVADSIILMLKQMMFADGMVKKTELETAISYLRDNPQSLTDAAGDAETRLRDAEAQSIFPLATILRRSLDKEQLKILRQQLENIALSDGEFHPFEQDFLLLFDELIGLKNTP